MPHSTSTSEPPAPEPDEKDWTWTIRERCADCGFDATSLKHTDIPNLTRRYSAILSAAARGPSAVTRPAPAVWSSLEYACHVRDVCALFAVRLEMMLTEDDPEFVNWDQDAAALEERYWEQLPNVAAEQLDAAAEAIATAFGAVREGQWQRPGRRSNGTVFTIDTFARYFLHDLAHHSWDVTGHPVVGMQS